MEWHTEQVTPSSIELAIDGRALGECAGDEGDRVVAALAVACELDTFFRSEEIDVFGVPGGAEELAWAD